VIEGPDAVDAGDSATFSASGSSSYSGDQLTFAWTLPDGSTATTPTVRPRFDAGGTATLSVTVTDPDGRTATASKSVTVRPAAAPPAGPAPPPPGSPSPPRSPSPKLALTAVAASLHGGRHPYLIVHLQVSRRASVLLRLRDERGRVIALRRASLPAARRRMITLRVKTRSAVRHGRHWRLTLRATELHGHTVSKSLLVRVRTTVG
jgi:hypothetical protein